MRNLKQTAAFAIISEACDWYIRAWIITVFVWKSDRGRWGLTDGDGAGCLDTPWFRIYIG